MDIKLTDDQLDFWDYKQIEVNRMYEALRRAGAQKITWPLHDMQAGCWFAAVIIPDDKRTLYRCLRAVANQLGCRLYTDTYSSTTGRQYFRAKGEHAWDPILHDMAIKLVGEARLRRNCPKTNAGDDALVLAITLTETGIIKEHIR